MRWRRAQRGSVISRSATGLQESGLGDGWTHIFSPTVVMEVTSGVRHNHEAWYPYGGRADFDNCPAPPWVSTPANGICSESTGYYSAFPFGETGVPCPIRRMSTSTTVC